ncbi:hypothetical protein [Leptolyngbya sp. FACHB-16]|uniref:hypothetical protein n=1 Tax=unclassified Leptolyngbya TaxID=2650499 RepID=UPI001688A6F8|nr:hypothetical protein [Leptolyngbya sp. FACHB-16]MBD2152936.1 hypothetical protein [Leptolyngbya sp. FACHB-16]
MHTNTEVAALKAIQKRAVDSQFSHLWSDALFAREQTRNLSTQKQQIQDSILEVKKHELAEILISRYEAEIQQIAWDIGSYIRWTVVTAWMAFERAMVDATSSSELSRDLPTNLPKFIAPGIKKDVFWAAPPWSEVRQIQQKRNKFVHRDLETSDLFPDVNLAEDTIRILRKGIKEAYKKIGKISPIWVECDEVPRRLGGSFCAASTSQTGADEDPQRLQITYVHGGRDITHITLRSDNDPWPVVEEIAIQIRIPIEAIRIYKGESLWREIPITMRGS